jgi:hypothetical protein
MLTIEDYVIRNWQRLSPINSWISGDPIMSKSETAREPLIFSCEMPEGDREAQAIFVCMEMLNSLACQQISEECLLAEDERMTTPTTTVPLSLIALRR